MRKFVGFYHEDGHVEAYVGTDANFPFYRYPKVRPMFAVIGNGQKHSFFRGREVLDPNWIGLWDGTVKRMLYLSVATANTIAKQEDEWLALGFPRKDEVEDWVDGIELPYGWVGRTKSLLLQTRAEEMKRLKREQKSHS